MERYSNEVIGQPLCQSPKSAQNPSIRADSQEVDSVTLLLPLGTKVNEIDQFGLTPLHYAAKLGQDDVAQHLLANGADVNAVEMLSGRTPIFYASNAAVADVLLMAGADINQRDVKGRTALHKAAEDGLIEVARILISKGADVNDRDHEGWTPLHYAAHWQGNDYMMGVLLFYGADSRIVNRCGMTPCDLAPSLNHRPIVPV